MSEILLARETARLTYEVRAKLTEMGCYHRIETRSKTRRLPVPTEKVCYDLASGLIWMETGIDRLPRGYTAEKLRERGLQEQLERSFNKPVVVEQVNDRLVVMAMVEPVANASASHTFSVEFSQENLY